MTYIYIYIYTHFMHCVKYYCVYEITPFVAQELNVHNLLNFTN